MFIIIFIVLIILISIVFTLAFIYQSIHTTKHIYIKSCSLKSTSTLSVSNNETPQTTISKTPNLNLYFTDTSSNYITSGLINNIYIDLNNNTRIPLLSTKHKAPTPIEFSNKWMFKQIYPSSNPDNNNITHVIFDFIYIDVTIDMNTRYRVYMHDNDTFRMGEIIKYDFNKTLHWLDQNTKTWTTQHPNNNTYTAPILQSAIKLTPNNISKDPSNNNLTIDCPITNHILNLIPLIS